MALIHKLDSRDADFQQRLSALLAFEASTDDAIETAVAQILDRVRREGDAAVLEFTRRFDGLDAPDMAALELPRAELLRARDALPVPEREALELAVERVRAYHQRQLMTDWDYTEADGTVLGQKVTPLDRAGLYVPGGKASYPPAW